MAFESLTDRLAGVFKKLRGHGKLTEADIKAAMREVRMALLEADVNYKVAKDFCAKVSERAMGQEVMESLTPAQQVVKIVNEELVALMGGSEERLKMPAHPPAVIMMCGLQGAGKTTTAGKLGKWLKEEKKKKVLTVSADVYRPAAIDQLQTVSQQANIDFFPSTPNEKPLDIARKALEYAKLHYYDVLIVDTAGRLAIDEQMMNEVSDLEKFLNPIETFFVVDAMVGQDAVNTAKAFGEKLPLTGVILTKVDGDSRGGAALSVRMVTGKPIKFMGVGEKLNGFQRFDPQAMAGRILGMGDIVSLVDEVRKNVDIEKAQKFAEKMRRGDDFTLEDFKDQLAQVKNMGSFSSLIEKLPAQFAQAAGQVDDEQAKKQLARTEAIINSMTPHERRKPEIIKASRKRRIAAGAGTTVQEVNRLLKQFETIQQFTRQLSNPKKSKGLMSRFKGMGLPF